MMVLLDLIGRAILAAILIFAGGAKIARPQPAALFLGALWHGLKPWASLVIFFISLIEIGLGATLAYAPLVGASGAGFLFGVFAILLLWARRAGINLPCGCFGDYKFGLQADSIVCDLMWGSASLMIAVAHTPLIQNQIGQSALVSGSLILLVGGIVFSISRYRNVTPFSMSRRTFLKISSVGVSLLMLAFYRAGGLAALGCCWCQYYDHWDPPCCGNPPRFHTHHYFKRCCNICTGEKGAWHHYQSNACMDCDCSSAPCDVMYSCIPETCYPSECRGNSSC